MVQRLFQIEDQSNYVMKVAGTTKRSRPDVELLNNFLITRVHKLNKDDWYKAMRMMIVMKTTVEDRRTIGADNLQHMIIMVDSTHAVHEDMSRHKGGMISFGT